MKKIILSLIIFSLLAGAVLAQEAELPAPGFTPDNPLYFLDLVGEKIAMFFTFSNEKKAEKALKIAEEKLAEVKAMAEKNKTKAIEKANQKYEEFLNVANQKAREAKEKGKNVDQLVTLISEKTLKHQGVLLEVYEKVPKEAKSAIEKAIEVSKKGFETALEAVSGTKREELWQRVKELRLKPEEKIKAKEEVETPPIKEETEISPEKSRRETETSPKEIKPEEEAKTREKITESIQLEEYDGNFFKIKKPAGWEIITAGSCETFSFYIKDKEKSGRQIFYFGEVNPLYLDEEQKNIDKQYMEMGGYPIPWYEMPVVKPLTPENFLKRFHLVAQTNIAKNFISKIPKLENVEIISSTPAQSSLSGETKTMRALFHENGQLAEGLFYVTLKELLPLSGQPAGGIGSAFAFVGISAEKDKFKLIESKLIESLASLEISKSYIDNCLQQQTEKTKAILKAGRTLSEVSDMIMDSWEKRNKTDDIIAEKRSDAILGRDRVYDPETGEVYEVPLDFYDKYNTNREKYKMSNLQQLPANSWELWTAPLRSGGEIH